MYRRVKLDDQLVKVEKTATQTKLCCCFYWWGNNNNI